MAEDRPTNTEREQFPNRNRNDPLMPDDSPRASGVNIYEKPVSTKPALSGTLNVILALVLIVIIAYFVIQWLF